jgi:hypothetical protein
VIGFTPRKIRSHTGKLERERRKRTTTGAEARNLCATRRGPGRAALPRWRKRRIPSPNSSPRMPALTWKSGAFSAASSAPHQPGFSPRGRFSQTRRAASEGHDFTRAASPQKKLLCLPAHAPTRAAPWKSGAFSAASSVKKDAGFSPRGRRLRPQTRAGAHVSRPLPDMGFHDPIPLGIWQPHDLERHDFSP